MPEVKLETSQQWKDVNYAGDNQAFHTCDIYLPKEIKDSYPVVIHIYGSAWFSNNSKGMADLGTIVKALLDAGYAVVCPNHRSSMDAKWPAQIHDIKAVIRFVRGEAKNIILTLLSLPHQASLQVVISHQWQPPQQAQQKLR